MLKPLEGLGDAAVLSAQDMSSLLPGQKNKWTVHNIEAGSARAGNAWRDYLTSVSVVVSAGHYMPVGAVAEEWSRSIGALFVVIQHGLMTPYAPPLPKGAHLLAFSEADASFWASGRTDITSEAVGSQLLWKAQQNQGRSLVSELPLFLGQLHGAELPRSLSAKTAATFCREVGAEYRPHPAETDILSRMQHARWAKQGIVIDSSMISLLENPRPVVSIFSTGVLEAAAAGIPSWVTISRPVAWVSEFWDRYGMAQWGGEPTPAPLVPQKEPAKAIAEVLVKIVGNSR
ncbi:MAG: hypothetical protein JJE28_00670 [Actinomycetales bacterium]|nr:hypothetical protein [Actinomycetales bacterium]